MLIIKDRRCEDECTSSYGNMTYRLTKEEIEALLNGEMLGDPDYDEYGVFICMER